MTTLAGVMFDDDLRKPFEVDLLRCGLDMTLPARQLALLATYPVEGTLYYNAVAKRENNDEIPWTMDQHLAAGHINMLMELIHVTKYISWASAGSGAKKSDQPKRQDPLMPPGYVKPKPVMLTEAKDVAKFMRGINSGRSIHHAIQPQ